MKLQEAPLGVVTLRAFLVTTSVVTGVLVAIVLGMSFVAFLLDLVAG